MNIRELKGMEVGQLVHMATELKVAEAGNLPLRQLLFKVIQAHAANNGAISIPCRDTRRP